MSEEASERTSGDADDRATGDANESTSEEASEGTTEEAGEETSESTSEELTDDEWRERLTDEEYRVLREGGTERPYSGEHVDRFEDGRYQCAACGAVLFESDTKFDAHCGWPSFWEAVDGDAIERRPDHSHGMERTEIVCANCGSHLGHVFPDGPEPTGERFCVNSVALEFEPGESDSDEE